MGVVETRLVEDIQGDRHLRRRKTEAGGRIHVGLAGLSQGHMMMHGRTYGRMDGWLHTTCTRTTAPPITRPVEATVD